MIKIMRRYFSKSSTRLPVKCKFKSIIEGDKSPKKRGHSELVGATFKSPADKKEGLLVSSDLLSTSSREVKHEYTPSENDFIYGIFPVLLSLKAQRRTFKAFYYKDDLFNKNDKVREIYRLCEAYGVPSYCVTKGQLIKLTGKESVHQGVCLEASPLSFVVLDDLKILNNLEMVSFSEKRKLWLYLDQINDPMNVGAVLRTAYYLGVDKVLTSGKSSCPITTVVSKASSGAVEVVPVFQVLNEIDIFKSLQELDWQIIVSSTSLKKSIPLHKFQPTKNIVLIVGNEGRGISKELELIADVIVTIPSTSDCDVHVKSLNVSVATSILLYSLLCMRKL